MARDPGIEVPGASPRAPVLASTRTAAALTVVAIVALSLNLRTAVAGVPPLLPDLGLSSVGESLLTTLPVVCFGFGALAGPGLRARLGEERALLAVTGVLVSGILVRAAWPDAGLFPGTILVGSGIAVMNVLLTTLIKRRFPDHIGAMTATYTVALVMGAGIGSGLTVPVLEASGSLHVALGVWALPAAGALALWVTQVRAAARPAPARAAGHHGGHAPVRLRRSPLAWQVTAFMGLQSLVFFAPLSWLPTIYREEGLGAASAGGLLSLMTVVSMLGTLLMPPLAARRRDQRGAVCVACALLACGFLGILLAPVGSAPVWVALLGMGHGASLSLALLMIVLRSPDGETAARLSAMAQGVGYLIAATGPLLAGLLRDATGGWEVPLLVLLAVVAGQLSVGLGAGRRALVGGRPPGG